MRSAYRYTHCKSLADGGPQWLWVMLNPLSQDSPQSPQTLSRMASFTRSGGGGGFFVAHLYAWTTPSAVDLFMLPERQRTGRINDRVIGQFVDEVRHQKLPGGRIVVAWGDHPKAESRASEVVKLLRVGGQVHCLGTSKSGAPRHPSYVPTSQKLVPFA